MPCIPALSAICPMLYPAGLAGKLPVDECSRIWNISAVQIVAKRTLRLFWRRHPQAEGPLRSWHAAVAKAQWNGPADVKKAFGANVDFLEDHRIVFDIAGNKFRMVVHVAYRFKRVLVKFVGTHKEYDRIDPGKVRR